MAAELRHKLLRQICNKRMMSYLSMHKKRFYQKANILPDAAGYYYIQLDSKTIKTPLRNQLLAPTKPLALAIANEWNMQITEIDTHSMPLTSICNTTIDNPTKISKSDLVYELINFLHTDTICCLSEEPERLVILQNEKWLPVRDWFSKRYNVNISASSDLFTNQQDETTIRTMHNELMSFSKWQLNGLQTAIDGIKSFILPMAVIGEELTIEDAVYLSRLEVEFQMDKWGRFEAVHDIDKFNQEAAVAAGILFYQLSTCSNNISDT